MRSIKNAASGYIEYVVKRLCEELQPGKSAIILNNILGPDTLVVPCPRSTPLVRGGLWPAQIICNELVKQGLAARSAPLLVRAKAVQKSSIAGPGKRPKPLDHIESIVVEKQLPFVPSKVVVVDDVVTRGATFIAAVSHLKHCFPDAVVQAFALIRTMSNVEVEKIIAPVIGMISMHGQETYRDP